MGGKPSVTAIPYFSRPIPLRLDDLCINTLPLCYSQVNTTEKILIRSLSTNGIQPAFSKPSFSFILYLLQTQPVEENLPALISIYYGTSVPFTSPAAKERLGQGSAPNSISPD